MRLSVKISAPILLSAAMVLAVNNISEDLTRHVTVEMDGVKAEYKTYQTNVGDFLKERGIELETADYLDKPFTVALNKEDSIKIKHSVDVTVTADGESVTYQTTAGHVRELLAKEYIRVGPLDKLNFDPADEIKDGMQLAITRITQQDEVKLTELPFATVSETDPTLGKGIEKVKTEGVKGEQTVHLTHTYEDGRLINTETISEAVTKAPVDRVVLVGSKEDVVLVRGEEAAASASESSSLSTSGSSATASGSYVNFTLSFYTDLPEENGGYTVTATGDPLIYGCVASNYYPLGTEIYLEGWGSFFVGDRGGSDFSSGSRLDVFIPRNSGESNSAYYSRVNNLGKPSVGGYVN